MIIDIHRDSALHIIGFTNFYCISSLLSSSSQNTTSMPVSSQNSMFCSCPVSTQSLLPMSSQYIIFPVHIQSVHNLAYTYLVSIPSFTHILSEFHLSCPLLLVSVLPLLLMFRKYTISLALVQSVHHLCCPCTVSTLSLLPMSS